MYKKKIKIIICGVILSLTFNINSVFAMPNNIETNTDININTSINNQNNIINSNIVERKNDLIEKIQILDSQIEKNIIELNKTKENIKQTEEEIELLNKRNIETKNKLNKQDKLLGNRIKILGEKESILDYIDLLFSSKNLNSLIINCGYISRIIKTDEISITKLQDKQNNLEEEEKEINNKKEDLNNTKEDLENINENLNDKKNEQIKLLNELNNTFCQNTNIQEDNKYLDIVNNYLKDSDGCPEAVEIASQFLGVPYLWGGTTPSGFDCSGFTQYVYNKLGKSIPRIAEDQQNVGIDVPMDELKPGDLLFFGRPAHHVTIYTGNGIMIHSPHTGDVVKFSKIDFNTITNAKRIL